MEKKITVDKKYYWSYRIYKGRKQRRDVFEYININVIQLSNGEYYIPMKRFYSINDIQIFEHNRQLIKDVIQVEEVKGKGKRLFEDGDLGVGGVCNNEELGT